jgi:hypothetical protein
MQRAMRADALDTAESLAFRPYRTTVTIHGVSERGGCVEVEVGATVVSRIRTRPTGAMYCGGIDGEIMHATVLALIDGERHARPIAVERVHSTPPPQRVEVAS